MTSAPSAEELLADEGPLAELAVTLVAVRPRAPGDGRYEVLLSERGRGAFASGLWVFPGGRVDAGDASLPTDGDPSVRRIADRFGISIVRARALVGGVVREFAEEAAIVAPGPGAASLTEEAWRGVRGGSFRFVAPSACLAALARWLPPRLERRRFDTYFLVCTLPAGLDARADGQELLAHRWLEPGHAIEEHRAGRLPLLPPTCRTLMELSAFPELPALAAALEDHWPPVNAPLVRAPTPAEAARGGVLVTELAQFARPGLDGTRGAPFAFDGRSWSPAVAV